MPQDEGSAQNLHGMYFFLSIPALLTNLTAQILKEFPWYDNLLSVMGGNPALSLRTISSRPGVDHTAKYFSISSTAGSSYSDTLRSGSAQFGSQPHPPAGQPNPPTSGGQPYPPAHQPYPPMSGGQPYPPANQPYSPISSRLRQSALPSRLTLPPLAVSLSLPPAVTMTCLLTMTTTIPCPLIMMTMPWTFHSVTYDSLLPPTT